MGIEVTGVRHNPSVTVGVVDAAPTTAAVTQTQPADRIVDARSSTADTDENPTVPTLAQGGEGGLRALRLPANVVETLQRSGLSIDRLPEGGFALRQFGNELQRLTTLPHATVDGRLDAAGRVSIETREVGGVPVRLTYDPATRAITYDMGRYHRESQVPATMAELDTLGARAAAGDPTLRDSGDVRVDGTRVQSLRTLFGRVAPDALRDMRYVASSMDLGSNGLTTRGRAFVDSQRMLRGDSAEAFPAQSRQGTVHNELAHVAWERMTETAYRRANPDAPQDIPPEARRALRLDNYFDGFRGPSGVTIGSNQQADELVSDAASIGTNALDYYRVLEFARPGATVPPGYRATVDLARRLAANAVGEEALSRGLADDNRSLQDIVPANRLGVIQAQYVAAGRAVVERYDAELQQRFPARALRRTAS